MPKHKRMGAVIKEEVRITIYKGEKVPLVHGVRLTLRPKDVTPGQIVEQVGKAFINMLFSLPEEDRQPIFDSVLPGVRIKTEEQETTEQSSKEEVIPVNPEDEGCGS